jgi:hypothetical protein
LSEAPTLGPVQFQGRSIRRGPPGFTQPWAPPRSAAPQRRGAGPPRRAARTRPAAPPRSAAPQRRPAAPPRSAAPQRRPAAPPRSAAPQRRRAEPPRRAAPQSRPKLPSLRAARNLLVGVCLCGFALPGRPGCLSSRGPSEFRFPATLRRRAAAQSRPAEPPQAPESESRAEPIGRCVFMRICPSRGDSGCLSSRGPSEFASPRPCASESPGNRLLPEFRI